ncbi:MAG: hypothetical protein AAF664_25180 [Planctomycetota bacterium]
MASVPPWTINLLRRSIDEVVKKVGEPETVEKVKAKATELLQELPQSAARTLDSALKGVDDSKQAIERWFRLTAESPCRVLNTTGLLIHAGRCYLPLSDLVLDAGRDSLVGNVHWSIDERSFQENKIRASLESINSQLDAIVTSHFSASAAFIGQIAQVNRVVTHRANAYSLEEGLSLPDWLHRGQSVHPEIDTSEVGVINGPIEFTEDDVRDAIVVAASADESVPQLPAPELDCAARVAVLPVATLKHQWNGLASFERAFELGFDAVVSRTDGLLGGPVGGIIASTSDAIGRLKQHPIFSIASAPAAQLAMTSVALDGPFPLSDAFDAGEENLRSRAERLATRLSTQSWVETASVSDRPARFVEGGCVELPSRQVELRAGSDAIGSIASRLANADRDYSIWTDVDGETLRIDLRFLTPAQDTIVAESIEGLA